MAELLTEERILLLPVATALALFVVREVMVALLHAASRDAWAALRSRLSRRRWAPGREERS
jgi:hypothetical protein